MANGPISTLTYNGITAQLVNGYLDLGNLVSDDITPFDQIDYSTTPPTVHQVTKRTEMSSAGNKQISILFPVPVTKFSITVTMTTYDGSEVIIYDTKGGIIQRTPIMGSHDVVYDPAPTVVSYNGPSFISQVDLVPSTRPDYIVYTNWSWGDPPPYTPPTNQPAPPAPVDPLSPLPDPTGPVVFSPGGIPTSVDNPNPPRPTPPILLYPPPGDVSNLPATPGSNLPGDVPTITYPPYAGGGDPSFNSSILENYIATEVRYEILQEFGEESIYDRGLDRVARAIARAIRRYLVVDVQTVQQRVTVDGTALAGQGGIAPNPHAHSTELHAHKINAP